MTYVLASVGRSGSILTGPVDLTKASAMKNGLQLLAILMLAITAQASAEDRPLKTALFDLAPWTKIDGQPSQGIIPLLNTELLKELNEPVETVTVPYARMVRSLENGDIDFAIFFKSDASRKIADPLTVFYTMKTSLVGRDILPERSTRKIRIAHPRGVVFSAAFNEDQTYEKLLSNSHQHSVSLLMSGRVDAVAGPEQLILQLIDAAGSNQPYRVWHVININEVTLQFSKRSSNRDSMSRIQAAAERLMESGKVEELLSLFPYN